LSTLLKRIFTSLPILSNIMALSVKYRTGGLKQLESQEEYLFRQSIFENWHHFSDGWIHRP
jgi:hypothetical protein